jgi:hypothetical protein
MAKNLPEWLRSVDFTPKPKTVVAANGEVLIGSEVDALLRAGGVHLAKGRKHRKARKDRGPFKASNVPSEPRPKTSIAPVPPLKANISKKSKRSFGKRKSLIGRMTTVVPRLFGEPSSSYVVENGALVAKRNKFEKKKRKKKGSHLRHSSRSQSDASVGPPINSSSVVQHMGKKDPMDASRDWATNYRDKGKFGSFPIHDAHGDESTP